MGRSAILKISFAVSILCLTIGLSYKILHYGLGLQIIVIALVAALVFTITALPEVWNSGSIHRSEKIMWTTGLLFMFGLTAILYLAIGRKKILPPPSLHNHTS